MIFILCLLSNVAKTQTCQYNPDYQPKLLSLEKPSLMMKEFQGLGYGYWFKYQPYILIGEGQQFRTTINSERKLLSAEFYNRTDLTIFHYAQFEKNQNQIFEINHYVELYTKEKYTIIKHTFNHLNYEGKWVLFAIQFDIKVQVLFFSDNLNVYEVIDQARRTDNMNYYLGYYGSLINQFNQTFLSFSQFKGVLSNFFILTELITDTNMQSIIDSGCDKINQCDDQVQLDIFQQKNFNGDSTLKYSILNYRDQFKYSVSMWVKQYVQRQSMFQKQVLLRISLTQNYTDLDRTDKELYLEYQQSLNDQENGIIISTYSFDAPIYGNGEMNYNTISILDSNLINGLKYWHFMQYDFGNTQGNFNNKFTLTIPSISYEQIEDFGQNLNHFTGSPLYFYIGGGILKFEKQFHGQINNFNFYYCQSDDLQLMNQCFYQCDTCNGPTRSDCISCPAGSNRILQESQCICPHGFIEQQIQDQVCLPIEEVYPIVNLLEIPYVCELQGYDQCQEEIVCSYGYFKYLNKCYQWYQIYFILSPEQVNDQINIFCTDCILNPNSWNLVCQNDLLSQQQDYTLIQKRRKYPQIYYMINYNDKYYLLQCQGCKQYQMTQNQLIILECLESFYLTQNSCQNCGNNCLQCTQTQCLICEQGYVFNKIENQCKRCDICQECAIDQTFQIICQSCPDKYNLTVLNQCQQCGINCETCNQYQCLTCAQNTFISIDGKSCQSCDIDNCEICFFQYLQQNTLDFQFQQLPLQILYQTQCAKCLDNYYLSNNICLSKSQLSNIPVIQFDGCVTGVIETLNTLVCLIGSTSTAIEINNCQSVINNCKNCIKNYNGSNQCIICIDGYYVNLQQNKCLECPINCFQCLQQSKVFQDGWKYKIRAFYEYFINSQKDHYFEYYGLDQNQQNYQIVCISCNPGQVLYDGVCINDCDSSCLKCEIINGLSQCLQCKPNEFGYIRSIDNQLQCVNCPFKCKACIQRDFSILKQINNIYNANDGFSNQCIQKFDNNFLDNGLGLVVQCESSQKCHNKLLIILNVYCDHDDYITQQNLQTDILFLQGSLYVDDIQNYIDNIFTNDLYYYLNQQIIQDAEIQLQLLQGQQQCFFNNLNISNSLQQHVFALKNVKISFIGGPIANLQINEYLNLVNFTDYVFENINFITNQIQPAINIISHKSINLQFINSQIVQSQDFGLFLPIFNLQNPSKILFNTFNIIGTQIQNSNSLFYFQYTQITTTMIQINDFIIQDSLISNTQFFSIFSNINLLQITIACVNLQFINSQLSDNFIFYYQQKQIQDIGIIDINQITLLNSQFSNSSIISAECIKQSTMQGIQSQMLVLQNSTLFRQNTMTVSNALFEFSIIIFSTLFSNFANQIDLINQNVITFTQITFSDTQYMGSNSFINISQLQNQNVMITLDTITLLNNHLPEIQPMFQQIRDVSYRQSSIFISCNSVQLNNIFIDRAPGYSEISLIYTINILIQNFTVSTNEQYKFKLIQSDLSCFQMTSFLDFYFVLYIFDFQNLQFTNITINNTYVVDYSIIIVESASQIDKQQQESITITNGQFNFNRMAIINSDRESSIIRIKSQQQQTLIFFDIFLSENILKLYIQDNLKTSATTFLIQSDFALSQMDNLTFKQNYIINSISSPLVLQVESILINNTNFYNNSVFDFDVWKSSFSWGYLGDVYDEQIYLQDQRLMPYGGSVQMFAQIISITRVNLNGSFGLSGGGFYLKTKGIGDVKIIDSNFSYSRIDGQTRNSYGGTIILFSENSFLNFFMDNIKVEYVFSRYYGGFMMLQPSAASISYIVLQNIKCINCFAIYGGFFSNISPFATSFGISVLNITNVTLSNYDIPWWSSYIFFNTMSFSDYQDLQSATNFIWVFMVQLNIQHVKMYNSSIFQVLSILQAISVVLNDFDVQDNTPFLAPMISIGEVQQQINITNFRFSKIDQINYTNSTLSQCNLSMTFVMMQQFQVCMPDVYNEDQYNSSSFMTKEYVQNQYECFKLNVFYFTGLSLSGLIFIETVIDLLFIQNVTLTDVKFHFANWGMIGIVNYLALPNSVQINNLVIEGCSCDFLGCLLITQNTGLLSYNPERTRILTEYIDEEQSNIQQQSFDQLNVTATVQNSKFINNKAIIGTGIGSYGLNLLVKNCIFLNNYAQQVGGAIYFAFEPFNLILIDTIIMNNTSGQKQGEGIYLQTKSFSRISSLNDVVQFNGDQDVHEWPYSISMIFNNKTQLKSTYQNDSQILIEMIQVQPYTILGYSEQAQYLTFPAGQQLDQYKYFDPFQQKFIPYNLSLRIIPMNRQNQRIYNLTQGDFISFTARINDGPKQGNFTTNQFTQAFVYYSNYTQDFNLDNLTLYFASNYSSYLEIKIICSSLKIPTYDDKFPYNQNGTKSYELRFKVKTFPCQLGEYFDSTNQSCTLCTGRSYSVSYNATRCSLKDDTKIVSTNQALIQLQYGYWRAYYNTPIIDQCYHQLGNCPGGWSVGNGLCISGHIGALCEQCDLYNIRGNGSYYVTQNYSCNTCQSVSQNIVTIILISMWALLSIFITVFSTLIVLKDFILRQKLRILGYIIVDPTPAPAVLIKVLTNYLQIIFTISTFQLQIPSDLTLAFNSIGNPVQVMSYSLDCFIVNLTSINIMYFRIVWSIIMCLIYVALFFSGYVLAIFMKKAGYTITVITTCLIYIYLYLSPNFIGSLISLISYRYISGEYWIQGNIAYRYDTRNHFKWLLGFAFPSLFVIALIIPIFLWYCVHTNKELLQETKTKKIWGYLYNEYRRETYYWETIKIILKEFIIIVLAYYEDYIPIKAALIFLSLFFYSFLTIYQKPYNTGLFNRLDSHQTTICAVSIILATTIHSAQQYQLNEIVWPFYILIGVLNGLFFLKILYYLIQAYTSKLENQIDSIKEALFARCPNLFFYHPTLREFFESNSQRKKRVKQRFNRIKQYLMPQARLISTFKKNNNIELPQSNQTIKLTNLGKMSSIKGVSSQELVYNNIHLQEAIITSPKYETERNNQPPLFDAVHEEE